MKPPHDQAAAAVDAALTLLKGRYISVTLLLGIVGEVVTNNRIAAVAQRATSHKIFRHSVSRINGFTYHLIVFNGHTDVASWPFHLIVNELLALLDLPKLDKELIETQHALSRIQKLL